MGLLKKIVGGVTSTIKTVTTDLKKVGDIITSPNPLKAASNAIIGGGSSPNKSATRSISSDAQPTTETGISKATTILGYTMPLWIWLLIIIAVILGLYWLVKRIFFKKRRTTTRRRSFLGSSSAVKARMARVRAFRRKKK